MKKKNVVSDVLFAVQLLLGAVVCGKQFFHMLKSGAEGVSIVMFSSVEVFIAINLVLAVHAHQEKPSRVTLQNIFTYSAWVFMWGANLALLSVYLFQGRVSWSRIETATLAALGFCVVAVYVTGHLKGLGPHDPIVRGYAALAFKGVPHMFQGGKFLLFGAAGYSLASILVGHVSITIRLTQLWFSLREASWDRNRVGSAISEIGNELTWIFTTLCWVWWRFNS